MKEKIHHIALFFHIILFFNFFSVNRAVLFFDPIQLFRRIRTQYDR